MNHASAAALALLGTLAMAMPVANASAPQGAVQLAHAHAHASHGQAPEGHAAHGQGGHAMAAAPSPEAIAAMPVSAALAVSDCWIRLVPAPAPSAGYFVAANKGAQAVTLTGAASPRYAAVMLHQTTHADGMSRMSHVQGAEIPAGQKLEFKPGGYHLMLEKPTQEIKVGDTVPMQFLLASGDKAQADCEVKPANTVAK